MTIEELEHQLSIIRSERDVYKAIIEAVSFKTIDATSAETMRKDWCAKNDKLIELCKEIESLHIKLREFLARKL